jgi:hypothetical protein
MSIRGMWSVGLDSKSTLLVSTLAARGSIDPKSNVNSPGSGTEVVGSVEASRDFPFPTGTISVGDSFAIRKSDVANGSSVALPATWQARQSSLSISTGIGFKQ